MLGNAVVSLTVDEGSLVSMKVTRRINQKCDYERLSYCEARRFVPDNLVEEWW